MSAPSPRRSNAIDSVREEVGFLWNDPNDPVLQEAPSTTPRQSWDERSTATTGLNPQVSPGFVAPSASKNELGRLTRSPYETDVPVWKDRFNKVVFVWFVCINWTVAPHRIY